MTKIKLHISCLSPVSNEALKLVKNDKYELTWQDHLAKDEDELAKTIEDADALYLGGDDFYSRKVLERAKNLKLISFGGTGYETFVDAKAARELGIKITNTPGAPSQSVAEFTIGLMLDLLRKITFLNQKSDGEISREIGVLKIGLIGYGNINRRIYKILHDGFGANVKFWNRTKVSGGVDLDEILAESDAIIIAITANDETRNFIDHEKIAKMKSGVILINPARPSLIDETALVDALKSGKISAVAMDGEVGAKSLLRKFASDKVIITPGMASRTTEAWEKMDVMAFQNIVEFFAKPVDENLKKIGRRVK